MVSTRDYERVATHCAPELAIERDRPGRGGRGSPSPLPCQRHLGK